jgi:hypothetical protein
VSSFLERSRNLEPIELLLNVGCCLLETIDFGAIIANGVAWSKSRENRTAIRVAKKVGEEPPEPSGWTTAFQIMTPMVITLTILLIVKWVRRIP